MVDQVVGMMSALGTSSYLLICGRRNDFLPRQIGTTGKSVARAKTCPALARKIFLFHRWANQ
jgi:hypothetical protein